MLTLAGDDLTAGLSVLVCGCVCVGVKEDEFLDADILMYSSVWWNAFPLKRDPINHNGLSSIYLVLAMLVGG